MYMYIYTKNLEQATCVKLIRAVTCRGVGCIVMRPLSSTLKLVPEQWPRGPQCQAVIFLGLTNFIANDASECRLGFAKVIKCGGY